jgi:hypothetical protein
MTNMTPDTLNAWIDGTLQPGERAEVDRAVSQDPALLQELLELQATSRLLADLPEYAPPRSFRLGAEFAKPTPISQAPSNVRTAVRLLPVVRALGVAAALIFMVVAGSLFFDLNGGSGSDAGTTFQQQSVIIGETTEHGDASEHAGDDTSNAEHDTDSGLVERGDSASAAEEPMDDLSAMAPGASEDQSQPAAEQGAPFGATEQGDSDHSTWIIASIVIGGVAVALAAAWFGMNSTVRQHRS